MLSQLAFAASDEMKDAMMEGAVKIDEAKMTGITPDEFTLIGKKEARAIDAVEPPFPAC